MSISTVTNFKTGTFLFRKRHFRIEPLAPTPNHPENSLTDSGICKKFVKVQGDATSANEVTVKISKVLDSSKLNVKAGWSHCQALSSTFLKEAQTCFFVVNGTFGTEDKDRKGKRHCRKNLAVLFALKTLDTIDNCQSPVFSLCVSQDAQNNNLWKFELNWSSKLQEDNGGKNTLVNQVVYFQTLDFETSNQILRSQNQIQIF